MATSPYHNTMFVLNFLGGLNLKSILDLGSGFGRWGFLCRCHLCGGNNLKEFPSQDVIIDAVEVFKKNISPLYDAVYNKTYEGSASEILPQLGEYDVIICGDMIEHLEKKEAWKLIEEMKKHARKAVVLSLPLGDCPQGPINDNEYEMHRSSWDVSEFRRRGAFVKRFPSFDMHPNAVVIWVLSDVARWALKTAKNPIRIMVNKKYPKLMKRIKCLMDTFFVKRKIGGKDFLK